MSAAPPAYGHLLKRLPSQARSVRRVEAILDAAAALLGDREPDGITIRDLAAAAGVPTGTIYQFFDDRDAVLQALAVRFVAALPDVMDVALAPPDGAWTATVDRVVDAFAAMIRTHPALRRLWLSGALDAATIALEREADARIAARLGARLRRESGSRRGTPVQWRTLVALIDGLLHHAFADDPDGDPVVLREARRAARAYAGAVLGAAT